MQRSSNEVAGRPTVVPARVYLRESRFADALGPEVPPAAWDAVDLEFSLAVRRVSERELTAALTARSAAGAAAVLELTYVAELEADEGVTTADLDRALEEAVFEAAPALLYPYLREEVSRLTAQSRFGALELPLLAPALERLEGFGMPEGDGESRSEA
jgi:preprotein translocase subunit SecB